MLIGRLRDGRGSGYVCVAGMSIVRPYRTWTPSTGPDTRARVPQSSTSFLIRYLDPKVEEMRVEK